MANAPKKMDESQECLKQLEKLRPLTLSNIKTSCIFELQRFINSRGTIDDSMHKVKLHPMTVFEEDIEPTIKKIKAAHLLIKYLESANTLEEIKDVLQHTTFTESSYKQRVDLDAVIGKCLLMTRLLE